MHGLVHFGAFLLISCIDEILHAIKEVSGGVNQMCVSGGPSSAVENEKTIRMVELGCGTGIGGLATMLATRRKNNNDCGITCYFTDYDPAVLCIVNEIVY